MTALRVVLVVLLVLAALLACPLTVEASFGEELHVRVGYLFFHYVVTPRPPAPEKPEKAKKKQPEEAPKENKLKELYEQKGLSGFLALLKEASRIASGAAKDIFSHLVFQHFWLKIAAGGEDAAKTALNYGYVCAAVGSAMSLLFQRAKCRNCRAEVTPDFQSQKSSVAFDTKARILVVFLVYAALRTLFRSFGIIKTLKALHNN